MNILVLKAPTFNDERELVTTYLLADLETLN